ncbi:MAG: RDD family protein [Candidatus Sulfotelmatobacter sp.]
MDSATHEMQELGEPSPESAVETALSRSDSGDAPEDGSAWRQEVAARLNRYQSRHKPRPPRYPSLRLRFEGKDSIRATNEVSSQSSTFPPLLVSNQALALEPFSAEQLTPSGTQAYPETPAFLHVDDMPDSAGPANAAPVTAKIIEFPRSWTPPPAPLDELAEAVFVRPRILEAPEVVPPPPALGGITIEPVPQPEFEKRPGIDIPLQGAPLARRILAALIDDFILATACALFGFIFWKLTAIQPPRLQMVEIVVGLASLFWAVYQYLLMVYAGTTPGLRLARLELTRFDGSPAGRRLRRWRVLASYLSAISLGMGYGWVLLDEDSLCWHDRITHTYLSPVHSQPKQPERPQPDATGNGPYQSPATL